MDILREIQQCITAHLWARNEVPELLKRCAREITALREGLPAQTLDEKVERAALFIEQIAADTRYSLNERQDAMLKVVNAMPHISDPAKLVQPSLPLEED